MKIVITEEDVTTVEAPEVSYEEISGKKDEAITEATPTVTKGTATKYALKTDSTLPAGLTLDETTGKITGTPTEALDKTVTIEVSYDDNGETKTVETTVEIKIVNA